MLVCIALLYTAHTEAESEEKHGVWDPMPELTITSLMSTPESTQTPVHLATLCLTLTLCQSRLYPVSQGLGIWPQPCTAGVLSCPWSSVPDPYVFGPPRSESEGTCTS
jgi:hypothetical protein